MFSSILFLILCLLVLFLGPVLNPWIAPKKNLMAFLDGFVLTAVLALLFCHILPHAMETQGAKVLAVAFVGMMLPNLIERLSLRFADVSHKLSLILAIVGLVFHMFADGVALVQPQTLHTDMNTQIVPLAIFLHSIPMGLMVWWIVRPNITQNQALLILLLLAGTLILGFAFGSYAASNAQPAAFELFEGLVMGSLMHVMFHRHGPHVHTESKQTWQWAAGLGSLSAIFVGIGMNRIVPILSHSHFWSHTSNLFLHMAYLSAPALLFAYLAGGFIQVFLPKASVAWIQRGSAFSQAFRGMVFGLPLPVCSCGVVPLYKSLIARGAPLAAALAFFVATPELGVDAFLLSLPLLGKTMMILRLLSAAIVALLTGWLMGLWFPKTLAPATPEELPSATTLTEKIKLTFASAFGEIVDHTGPWIMVGILVAALIEPILSMSSLANLPSHWQVLMFALLGMPVYVCASGATPLVAVMMTAGLSPGAALAFLITGPATNVTTFGILSKLHSKKVALTFAATIFTLTLVLGWSVNAIFGQIQTPGLNHDHHTHASLMQQICLWILLAVFAALLVRKGPRHLINQILSFEDEDDDAQNSHDHSHIKTNTQKTKDCCH